MLVIPKMPKVLRLPVGRLWNGERSPDARVSVVVEIGKTEGGILIKTINRTLFGQTAAAASQESRTENIDSVDRVCVFFVEEGGQYLEVKIAPDGHYLINGFDGPHQLVADFKGLPISFEHKLDKELGAINEIVIPLEIFPSNLSAINAFFISGRHLFAYYPLTGSEPDPHQPNCFPLAKLEE